MKKGKRKKVSRNHKYQLTTYDLEVGFLGVEEYRDSEYQRHKRRLGIAPGKGVLIQWK